MTKNSEIKIEDLTNPELIQGCSKYINENFSEVSQDIDAYRWAHDPALKADFRSQFAPDPEIPELDKFMSDKEKVRRVEMSAFDSEQNAICKFHKYYDPYLEEDIQKGRDLESGRAAKYVQKKGSVVLLYHIPAGKVVASVPDVEGHFNIIPKKGFDMEMALEQGYKVSLFPKKNGNEKD